MEQKGEKKELNMNPNLPVRNTIGLDWDIQFEGIKKSMSYNICTAFCKEYFYKMYIRKSSTGNTHVRIELPYKIPFTLQLMIRAYLRDDAFRITNDLRRLLTGQDYVDVNNPSEGWESSHTDILFDEKIISADWIDRQKTMIEKDIRTLKKELEEIKSMRYGIYKAGNWERVI